MNEKVEYKFSEFTDFTGTTRKIVVAAVSRPLKDCTITIHGNVSNVAKVLLIGFAICNPLDEYNEEVGKKIAYCKAVAKNNPLTLYTVSSGMVNTKMVEALIDQEIEYFNQYPESHIKGYNDAYIKFIKKQQHQLDIEEMRNKLTAAEHETIQYIKNLSDDKRKIALLLLNEG